MAQVSVTGTATLLAAGGTGSVLICNRGAAAIFVDFVNTVTTSTGFEIDAGQSTSVGGSAAPSSPGQSLYAITAGTTVRVDVLTVLR